MARTVPASSVRTASTRPARSTSVSEADGSHGRTAQVRGAGGAEAESTIAVPGGSVVTPA